jgi:hypothetical protein
MLMTLKTFCAINSVEDCILQEIYFRSRVDYIRKGVGINTN